MTNSRQAEYSPQAGRPRQIGQVTRQSPTTTLSLFFMLYHHLVVARAFQMVPCGNATSNLEMLSGCQIRFTPGKTSG
jgi:hypothetical protein